MLDDIGLVDSEESLLACAMRLATQAERILKSTEGWVEVAFENTANIKLETKPIKGEMSTAGSSCRYTWSSSPDTRGALQVSHASVVVVQLICENFIDN